MTIIYLCVKWHPTFNERDDTYFWVLDRGGNSRGVPAGWALMDASWADSLLLCPPEGDGELVARGI